MKKTEYDELLKEEAELKARLAELQKKIDSKQSSSKSIKEAPKKRTKQRPLRDLVLEQLTECDCLLYSQTLSNIFKAKFGRDIQSTRFGSLANDERKSFEAGRPKPVFLCHGLTFDSGRAVKRVWARSDWDLTKRIIGPHSGRVNFLKYAIWIITSAKNSKSEWQDQDLLSFYAADAARDCGAKVRKGTFDYDLWLELAKELLSDTIEIDQKERVKSAEGLKSYLNEHAKLFGANEPLVSLPGTQGEWRTHKS